MDQLVKLLKCGLRDEATHLAMLERSTQTSLGIASRRQAGAVCPRPEGPLPAPGPGRGKSNERGLSWIPFWGHVNSMPRLLDQLTQQGDPERVGGPQP